ncbi:MAG: response regulator transcription factor [Bacteroidota bacterium]
MYWQLIGFGLTVGWLWLFFLSGPVFTAALKEWPGNPDIYFLFFMLCTALTYLCAGRLTYPALTARKKLLFSAALFLSASTWFICRLPHDWSGFGPAYGWLIYPLIAIGACCLVIFLLGWLEVFLSVSVKNFALIFVGAIIIASILLLAGVMLDFNTGTAILLLLPWLILTLILRQTARVPSSAPTESKSPITSGHAFPLKLIWLIILFYTAGGLMFKLVGSKYVFAGFFWISNFSYMAVVILAGCAVHFIEDLDLRWLYRPVLPLLAAGFILFPFFTGKFAVISFLFLQAGFALFDMYTWLVIVYVARGHSRPTAVLGLGMFWITLAMFGGNLIFTVLAALIPLDRPIDTLAVIAGLVTLLTVFVFQDKKETFTGWENSGEGSEKNETKIDLIIANGRLIEDQHVDFQRPDYEKFIQNHDLTVRETEILALILKGRNNPFISEKLNISPNTLKFHLRNIYHKFAVNNRQELISLLNERN